MGRVGPRPEHAGATLSPMSEKLQGLNVVFFESRHTKAMADLIRLQGGNPVAAQALKEVPLEENPQAFLFAEKLFRQEIDALVLLTGVGSKALLAALETRYKKDDVLNALRKIPIAPRGPKPIRVLNDWKVPYAVTVPEPNTWRELLQAIREWPLRDKTVAVQEYGVSNPELIAALEKRGARVLRVPVYRWALPDDLGPLQNAIQKIIAGEIHVVIFTTAVQVEHLFQVAEKGDTALFLQKKGSVPFFLKKIVVASIGPDCSEAIRSRGIQVDIEPNSSKMAELVKTVAEKAYASLRAKRSNLNE